MPDNETGLVDEQFLPRPDWIEIRNCSSESVDLGGIRLGTEFFGRDDLMRLDGFPPLAPGQHLLILADGVPSRGSLHAPFKLNRNGEQVVLSGTTASGAQFLIDSVKFGPIPTDQSLARLGCGGPWLLNTPTPRSGNVTGNWLWYLEGPEFMLAIPTLTGQNYVIEYTDSITSPAWQALPMIEGNGMEQTITQPLVSSRFYRVGILP